MKPDERCNEPFWFKKLWGCEAHDKRDTKKAPQGCNKDIKAPQGYDNESEDESDLLSSDIR